MPVQSITKLTPRHLKIVDYCIEGLTPKVIAEKLSMTPRQVGIIISSGSFQHQLSIRRSSFEENIDNKLAETEIQAADIIKKAAARAATRLSLGIGSSNETSAIRCAESILDRSGNSKIVRGDGDAAIPSIHISHEDLVLLNETLQLENDLLDKHTVVCTINNQNGEEQEKTCSGGQVDASSSPFSHNE